MLAQFVCHLINNEGAPGAEGVVGFAQQITFSFNLENAEWNSGDDVVAVRNTAFGQFRSNGRRIGIDHAYAPVTGELPGQVARKRGIKFKQ